jgi:hypothetical protein
MALAAAAALLGATAAAQADPVNWVQLREDKLGVLHVLPDVIHDASGNRRLWVKMTFAGMSESVVNFEEVNCAEGTFRTLQFAQIDAEGAVKSYHAEPLGWDRAVPQTWAYSVVSYACSN